MHITILSLYNCCLFVFPSTQVREVALEAVARARRGDGPTLIEAETYRFRGHSLADPDELRPKVGRWVGGFVCRGGLVWRGSGVGYSRWHCRG